MAGYDLHTHSNASDGSLEPEALVRAAYAAGVRCLALTDHDTLAGLSPARRAASELDGMRFVDGVELTCLWEGRVIHLLGLGIDPDFAGFGEYMEQLNSLRRERAEAIARKLVKKGFPDLLADAQLIAGQGQIGRPHFAQAMVARRLVASAQQAFDSWLGQGKIGDVRASWPALEDAVSLVKQAGGYAVIAHPTKYNFTFTRLRALVDDLLAAGGDGIEVSYPGVTPNHLRDLLLLAQRKTLLVSAGSDFHSPEQRWTALGCFPPFHASTHLLRPLLPDCAEQWWYDAVAIA
ncbi:phosphatase [Marinobacterium zhoushanense]|uniref:Phosphatase n=1 Tax=Marinobacterium zhoushanense TaxID=1679163 RepID=A0ABQ1K5H1_9GAMM|nr:phosphatase [Marinobacterium zhoushanense]